MSILLICTQFEYLGIKLESYSDDINSGVNSVSHASAVVFNRLLLDCQKDVTNSTAVSETSTSGRGAVKN